jgi:hypothetical protein
MVKHGFYLSNGHIKKFKNGQSIALNIDLSTEQSFVRKLPVSLLKLSKENPHAYHSLNLKQILEQIEIEI